MKAVLVMVALMGGTAGRAGAAPAQMRGLADTLTEILPLVTIDAQFEKPDARARLQAGIQRLTAGAHQVRKGMAAVDDDPVVPFITAKFERTLRRAGRLLKASRDQEARTLVRQATNYCIGCHTRSAGGGASIDIRPPKAFGSFSRLDQADFMTATRQFEEAIVAYEEVLNDKAYARRWPHRWERGAKRMLAIVIRVQQEPRLALEVLSKIRDEKAAPATLYKDALTWREAVKVWVDEAEGRAVRPKQDLALARGLAGQGDAVVKRTGSGDAGLVHYLRASAVLHDLLRQKSALGQDEYQEALRLAGAVAEHLASLNLWTLHEEYYEACVRYRPKTPTARQCFDRFKAIQPLEANPAGGAPVYPAEVQELLTELKGLAG